MDTGRTAAFAGGLTLAPENAIDESGFLGTRRGLGNIRWYEYTFLAVGILATLVTDGLTIVRLVSLGSFKEPEFAYGTLIIVVSIFLLMFLITGLLFQRIIDIIAFVLSSILLTTYVIAHYIAARNVPDNGRNTQPEIRLARLIFTAVFNVAFLPLAYKVIKYYQRDEFSKRLFGAFPAARLPLKIYSIFDCLLRINTVLSISTLVLNLYNVTNTDIVDQVLLGVGIPIALLWLVLGLGMARWEINLLAYIFYFVALFQLGTLIFILYIGIEQQIKIAKDSMTSTSTTTAGSVTTPPPIANVVPVLIVLYVCVAANFVSQVASIIMGFWCTRNFNKGLKEKVFTAKIDKWVHQHWSSN